MRKVSELSLQQSIHQRIVAYPNLSELFKDRIPDSPPLYAAIYKGVDVGRIWGERFTFWNVLLHDADPASKAVLQELERFASKHRTAYGEDRLRNQMKNDPFTFLSELIAYDSFCLYGISPDIEPQAGPASDKKVDLSVNLDSREILVEVKTPFPPADLVTQGSGFAPLDFELCKKLAGEMWQHFDITGQPTNQTIVMVDGLYSALDPFIVSNSIDRLNSLKESDFPKLPREHAKLLADRAKLFLSAVLLFRSNSGSSIDTNPSGPRLTEKEISTLKKVFQIQS